MKHFFLLLSLLSVNLGFSQIGAFLDNTFNSTGKNTTAIGATTDIGRTIAIQTNGKILVAGRSHNGTNFDFAVVRYNIDGSLDNNFGVAGKVTTAIGTGDDYGNAIAVQPDGKILLGGTSYNGTNNDFSLVRYNSDGSIDATFGNNGKVLKDIAGKADVATSLLIRPNGKIVIAGYTNNGTYDLFAAIQFNANGSVDNTFGANGVFTLQITSFSCQSNASVLQPDGKVILGGYTYVNIVKRFAVCRINTNGTIDNTFGVSGTQTTFFTNSDGGIITALALQSNGEIVATGYCGVPGSNSTKIALARYNSDGTHDNGFNLATTQFCKFGCNSSDAAYGISIKQNGDIILACVSNDDYQSIGNRNYFLLAYFDSVGYIRNTTSSVTALTPGANGGDWAYGVAIQSDDKIILAGTTGFYYSPTQTTTYKFAVARFTAGVNTGIEDLSADDGRLQLFPNPAINELSVDIREEVILEINIYDVSGSLVLGIKQPIAKTINVSELNNGVYIAEVKTKNFIVRKRWIRL